MLRTWQATITWLNFPSLVHFSSSYSYSFFFLSFTFQSFQSKDVLNLSYFRHCVLEITFTINCPLVLYLFFPLSASSSPHSRSFPCFIVEKCSKFVVFSLICVNTRIYNHCIFISSFFPRFHNLPVPFHSYLFRFKISQIRHSFIGCPLHSSIHINHTFIHTYSSTPPFNIRFHVAIRIAFTHLFPQNHPHSYPSIHHHPHQPLSHPSVHIPYPLIPHPSTPPFSIFIHIGFSSFTP